MLSGESLTGRRGAAALSRPATVSEPAEPAPTRAMNPPIDPPGGEIEEAPLPHSSSSGADVESGRGAPPKVPPPAKAWTMIIGAFVVLMFMLASVRTTTAMRQRVRDSTLEQIPNADGSAEKVPVFGPEIPRIRSKGTLCIKHPHHLPIAAEVPPPEPEPQEVNAVAWRKFADALADGAADGAANAAANAIADVAANTASDAAPNRTADNVAHAAAEGAEVAVVELADGLFQTETAALLRCSLIRDMLDGVLFAAPDALSAYGGVTILRDMGLEPLAVSGLLDPELGGSLMRTGNHGYVTNDQSNNQARYDNHRRSLYQPIIRNAQYGFFTTFDEARK